MLNKHYYCFGESTQKKFSGNKLNKENWDILRDNNDDASFSIEKTVELYEKNCENANSYNDIANIIINELNQKSNNRKIISLGAGKGILEWLIKRNKPNIRVECTDYTSKAIEVLRKVNIKIDDAFTFDMLNDDYSKLRDSIILMMRISTEFTRTQWYSIFEKMYKYDIQNIIYIPAELATRNYMINEQVLHIKRLIKREKDVFCGWLYSEKDFLSFFSGKKKKQKLYIVDNFVHYGSTAVFFLSRNSKLETY